MNITYPILVLEINNKGIHCFKSRFGICSIGGQKFYRNLLVIDSVGKCFKVNDVLKTRSAPIKYWILYFQKMLCIDYDYEDLNNLDLEAVKLKIIDSIEARPKYWLSLDTIEGLKQRIIKTNSYKELFLMFV